MQEQQLKGKLQRFWQCQWQQQQQQYVPQGPITCASLSSLCEQQKAWKHQGWAGQAAMSLALVNTMLFYTQTRTHTQTQCCIKVVWQATGDGDTMLTKSLLNPQTVRRTVPACPPPTPFPATPWQLPVRGIDEMLSSCYDWTKMDMDTSWTRTGAGEVWRNTNALMTTPGAKEHIKF